MRRDIYVFSIVSTVMFTICSLTTLLNTSLGSLSLLQVAGMVAICALFIANVMMFGIGVKLLIQKKEINLSLQINIVASLLVIVLMIINPNLFISFIDKKDAASSFVHLVSSLTTIVNGCLIPFVIHLIMFVYNSFCLYNEKKDSSNHNQHKNDTKEVSI